LRWVSTATTRGSVEGRRLGGCGDVEVDALAGAGAQVGHRPEEREPAAAEDGDPVGDPLDLRQDVGGEEQRGAVGDALPDERHELVLQQGSRPDEGSSSMSSSGRPAKAMTTPTFRRLPVLSSPIGRAGSSPKRSRSAWTSAVVEATPQRAVERDRLGHDVAAIEVELGRQEPQVTPDRDVALRLPKEGGGARGRPQDVEEEPDRRRLPRTVGPEEPEDLTGGDVEVEVVDGRERAKRFGQALGGEGSRHRSALHGRGTVCRPGFPALRRRA
jgi:hypothetical protein